MRVRVSDRIPPTPITVHLFADAALTPGKLAAAQRILATTTATETIEMALDMVVFRRELVNGTRAMLGVRLVLPDGGARA